MLQATPGVAPCTLNLLSLRTGDWMKIVNGGADEDDVPSKAACG